MDLFKGLSIFVIIGVAAVAFGGSETVPLFQPSGSNGTRSAGLVINQQAVSQLRSDTPSVSLGAVPLVTGESGKFRLTPMPIFAKNATIQVIKDDGTTDSVAAPDIKTWYGEDPDNPDRALFMAASPDGEVRAMITGDAQTSVTVISRDIAAGAGAYRIERNAVPMKEFCKEIEVPAEIRAASQGQTVRSGSLATRNNITYEIEAMIDVGHSLFSKFNLDASATLDYVTELFGSVNVIYKRDLNMHISLMQVTLWQANDPFSVPPPGRPLDSSDQLFRYQEYISVDRSDVPYDIAHLLDNQGLGGIAYLDVLQIYARAVRCGVSNVDAIGPFPTDGSWYWDTDVVSHEIGHNLGSPHTHCYLPPIDCCFLECASCTIEKPIMGTIMSYCHLQMNNGGGVDLRFHERCSALMRNRIETSLILSPYMPRPEIEVRGGEGTLIPLNSQDTVRSTLFRASAVGSAVSNTFEIRNPGGEDLKLTGNPAVTLVGLDLQPLSNSDFSVRDQPNSNTIEPGGFEYFTIEYNPSSDVEQWAVVEIRSNDADEGIYRFLIKGRLIQPSDPYNGTFDGSVVIPEQGDAWTVVPVVVEDVPGAITDVKVEFGGTDCTDDSKTGIEHPWVGDLAIMLQAPDGTTASLVLYAGKTTTTGAGGRNFCHTLLSDESTSPIQDITIEEAPYSGTYSPHEPLSTFIGGEPNGVWKFYFYDRAQPDEGIVHQVSVIVRGDSAEAVPSGPGPIRSSADRWRFFD